MSFTIKDSGERKQFESGMQRDTEAGKTDYTLVLDGPMFERWATHLTKGAEKYDARNWMKAAGQEELDRFTRSLLRHLFAYLRGETDEDHAAAVIFNLNGREYVREQMQATTQTVRLTYDGSGITRLKPIPSPMDEPETLPFKVGDRVRVLQVASDTYGGKLGTVVETPEPELKLGAWAYRVKLDDFDGYTPVLGFHKDELGRA